MRNGTAILTALAVSVLAGCGGHGSSPAGCGAPGAGWIAWIERSTGPFSISVARLDGSCALSVASDTGGDLSPSWAIPTQQLAYTASTSSGTEIQVHNFATGATATVPVAAIVPGSVALSPDGTKLAFDGRAGSASPAVYVVPVSGGDPVTIGTSTASDTGPAWSADGRSLFFVSDRGWAAEIWSAPADGSLDPVQITSGSKILGQPAVSPAGLVLAYSQQKPDLTSQIIEHTIASGAERVLSDEKDGEPAYDATGTMLAVSTYRYSPTAADVVVLDASTGDLVFRLADGVGTSGAPAFPR